MNWLTMEFTRDFILFEKVSINHKICTQFLLPCTRSLNVVSQKTSTSYRVSSFPSCLASVRFSTRMRERHEILSQRPFFPTSESVRFSGNHVILKIIDEKCDSRLNIYTIVCILKCLDVMESGLTEKQKEPPPENIEESSVLEFVESLALDKEGKHF